MPIQFFQQGRETIPMPRNLWDTLCIPKDTAARTKALRTIPRCYQDARITLVHDRFLRNWEWNEETACFGIIMSPWFSRGWTAVELAMSRKVKVIFKGPHGPLIKDLDEEILAGPGSKGPRKEASDIIKNLRQGINTLDDLLTVLGPRHTSWPKDVAAICALLAGVTPMESRQETYKNILRRLGSLSPGNLFHNTTTMSKVTWCPTSLLNMTISSSGCSLRIEENWDLLGRWIVIPVTGSLEEICVWSGIHYLSRQKATEGLMRPSECFLLTEPDVELGNRALLVKKRNRGYEYVGVLYFHPKMLEYYTAQSVNGNLKPAEVQLLADTAPKNNYNDKVPNEAIELQYRDSDTPRLVLAASSGDEGTVKSLLASSVNIDVREPVSQRTALHYAVFRGHHGALRCLLEGGANRFVRDGFGQQPLHLAAERGHTDMVRFLLSDMSPTQREDMLNAKCNYGHTALHRAAWGGSAKIVALLLLEGIDPSVKDNNQDTALHLAVEKGFKPVVDLLIRKSGVSVNSKGRNNMTPLHYAAIGGHEGVVELLLKNTAEVNVADKAGWMTLHLAALKGIEVVVQLLLNNGAEIDVTEHKVGWTPLHLAAIGGHKVVVELLLKDKPKVNPVDKIGWTPSLLAAELKQENLFSLLSVADTSHVVPEGEVRWTRFHVAAVNRPETVVEQLLQIGVNVYLGELGENDEDTNEALDDISITLPMALNYAAYNGYEVAVRLLVKKVVVDMRIDMDETSLRLAVMKGQGAIVQLLLEAGANTEMKDSQGQTPVWWAIRFEQQGISQLLLDKGANIEAKDNEGRTLLYWAAQFGHQAIVQLLLEKGVNIEARDNENRTPLWGAFQFGHEVIAQLLIDRGADIEPKDSEGRTILSWAAQFGHESVVRMLLDKGAVVETTDNEERTPLYFAAQSRHITIIQLLLDGGANIETSDKEGRTPLFMAAQYNCRSTAELLLHHGANMEAIARGKTGSTPLFSAVLSGSEAVVQLLLDKGANTEVRDEFQNGRTPLFSAAESGNEAVVKMLLDKGACLETEDSVEVTPLLLAVGSGHAAVVRLFLERGVDI